MKERGRVTQRRRWEWQSWYNIIMSQRTSKDTTEFVFCGHLLLHMGPTLKCSLFAQTDSVGVNWIFIFNCLSIGDSICVRDEAPLLLFSPPEPHLVKNPGKKSLWVYLCLSPAALRWACFLGLLRSLCYLRLFIIGFQEQWVWDLTETSHSELNISRILTFSMSGCGPLCFFPFCAGRSFPDNDWGSDLSVAEWH